jgi:hypothetical protein
MFCFPRHFWGGERFAQAVLRQLVVLVLSWVLVNPPAADAEESGGAATSPSQDDARGRARVHFDRGLALAKSGRWDAALAEFIASREAYATRAATRNAAVALRQLGRPAESLDYYFSLLRTFATSMPPEELRAVQLEMNALRLLVGELDVSASEAGASVVVDGRQRGTTPFAEPLRVDAGTHTVRLSKEGFETVETAITIAGGQRKVLETAMKQLRASGTLVVNEATGKRLEVVLDSAVVGETPWRGSTAPGAHSVFLRGPQQLGTVPSAADVRRDRTTTLTLRAVPLAVSVLVEPSPSNATVYVDGVSVGNGIWEGRLSSGPHRIEVTAAGHLSFRRDLLLSGTQKEVINAQLERDRSSPLWQEASRPQIHADVLAGALLARSFRGGATEHCQCSERSRPLGAVVGARIGYVLRQPLALEISGGYLGMSEELTRRVQGRDPLGAPTLVATDYEDTTKLAGPFAALSLSYRSPAKTPFTARVGVGLAALTATTSNVGTFTGQIPSPTAETPNARQPYTSSVSVEEVQRHLLTPFVSTEARWGYRFSKRISADLGLALLLFMPPDQKRAGNNTFSGEQSRAIPLPEQGDVDPGVLSLPIESVARAFLAISPTVGLRVDF